MPKTAALWHSGSRKEAMDLLQSTWPLLDESDQEHLTRAILAGPPDKLLENVDED